MAPPIMSQPANSVAAKTMAVAVRRGMATLGQGDLSGISAAWAGT
jgi:hypothetical protein